MEVCTRSHYCLQHQTHAHIDPHLHTHKCQDNAVGTVFAAAPRTTLSARLRNKSTVYLQLVTEPIPR